MSSTFFLAALAWSFAGDTIEQAIDAARNGQAKKAIALCGKLLETDGKNSEALSLRARLLEKIEKHGDALKDLDRLIALRPGDANLLQQRGCVAFKAGEFKQSVKDFDRFIEKVPEAKKSHWQRGISCYYAGAFDEGIAQFEIYQDFDNADVENAVWRFMCMAKKTNLDAARKAILKIGNDRRVPMRQVYDMFHGDLTEADVMKAAEKGDGAAKSRQLFYAHLYVGIMLDLKGRRKEALAHLEKAAGQHRIDHYMGDVARVHRDVLRKEFPTK